MLKFRKVSSILLALGIFTSMNVSVFANDISTTNENKPKNANIVIETNQNISIPDNVSLLTSSITFDHNADIIWDKGSRQVKGNTQAKQGKINLSSYTRARFENYITGRPYLDSGRVWSATEGSRSYASSGWEYYDNVNSGVAHTYYGI